MEATLFVIIITIKVIFAAGSSIYNESNTAEEMWISSIEHGNSAYHGNPNDYKVFRNVMDFGCAGDGVTDDTACINTAISSGGRCGDNCGSSTIVPALIYFPSGRYRVSSPIVMYYFSQLVGNALNPPTLVAAPHFTGMAILDTDPYKNDGSQWYINQNNFFRQVRNFIIDTTLTPLIATTTGIHWQVAQATSLVNIRFVMTRGSKHQGIWMENGSGGFMSDLTFEGGKFGMWVGNQQFLSRNLVFRNCETAIYMNWNWQWTFKDIRISNCGIGIDMSAGNDDDQVASGVGSILLLDSIILDTPIGVKTYANPSPTHPDTSGTLLLDNLYVTNVRDIVVDRDLTTVLSGGTTHIASWGRGSLYRDKSGNGQFSQGHLTPPIKDSSLLDNKGNFFAKSRPQYERYRANEFVNVKEFGVKGDGVTDDSDAIQSVINSNINGRVIYFPHGAYIITKTVYIPSGIRIIGELWSLLMAGGSSFKDSENPQPMLRVGNLNEVGTVELTDLMFGTLGSQPGAILVEWNLKGSSPGAAGMWDSHFRVGGFAGSELQVDQCPKGQGSTPHCQSAHTLLHLTESSSAYLENVWAWTGDHDLDNGIAQGQITVYTGRGVLVESREGPNWLYGTQSEHNVFYQYQLTNTRNIFMTMIQSETPYWQPGPPAPQPYMANMKYSDPTYAHCIPDSGTCFLSYGLRAHGSSNVYVYGAGLYNFFNNYDQTCLLTENCQDAMVDLGGNSDVYIYNLNTKAAKNIVVANDTTILARQADNRNGFCSTINFLAEAA